MYNFIGKEERAYDIDNRLLMTGKVIWINLTRNCLQMEISKAEDGVIPTTTNVGRVKIGKIKRRYIGSNIIYYPNSVKTFRLIYICGDIGRNLGPVNQEKSNKPR